MIAKQPYIIYQLPQTRPTQTLNSREIGKAWKNVQTFLINCSNANVGDPHSIYIVGYSADEDHGEFPEPAESILKKTQNLFGIGETNPANYMYPSGIPSRQTKTQWDLTNKDLTSAINHLIVGQPYPKCDFGPIELIISYDFKLVDPIKKSQLPNQQCDSSILIWLSKSNSINATLYFPFEEPNKEFWNYLNSIANFIPFKFDHKYLRLVRPNKKGTANIFSKL